MQVVWVYVLVMLVHVLLAGVVIIARCWRWWELTRTDYWWWWHESVGLVVWPNLLGCC